jgi:hypothetical protein
MSSGEVIEQIKHLPPRERVLRMNGVAKYETASTVHKAAVSGTDDGLPVIRAARGINASSYIRELEGLTP